MNKKKARFKHPQLVNAWCMYDWANSAFATTIMAAVLPVYYSHVAGATLPSEATATAYWSLGLSLSLLIVAIISPILGTVSDISRSKKKFLSIFAAAGIVGTGLMILVDTGDWMLASILFVLARMGFTGANVFYDALLPHVATEEEQDVVSTRGYALGYLGGGLLLAINVVMLQVLPGNWGSRLSFLSVAIWWAVFSIPVLTKVPEPPSASAKLKKGVNVISASFKRLKETLVDIHRYRELFKYLVAFLIYNDAIGTIIGVASIYGAELGFGSVQLVLALLLVQFVGVPFSLIFGRLPDKTETRRPFFTAFVIFNLVALPLVGTVGAKVLPLSMTGGPVPPYADTANAVGEGTYLADDAAITYTEDWGDAAISSEILGTDEDGLYASTSTPGESLTFTFNGQEVEITYSTGPDHGQFLVMIDGNEIYDEDTKGPVLLDAYNATVRYGVRETLMADEPGEHELKLVNYGAHNPESSGYSLAVTQFKVLSPIREGNLGVIIGTIIAVEALGLLFAWLTGKPLFTKLAESLDTRRSIILALVVYSVIAVWGFFLDSVFEFWFLAWMVAIVQGGSQALSRSLYAQMSPAAKSGEFFGLFGIMEKFSAILGPLLFALAVAVFGTSRPAILSLIVLFVVGVVLLRRVDIDEGTRVAKEEDRKAGLIP